MIMNKSFKETRRNFIKKSAGAASVLMAPSLFTFNLSAAETKTGQIPANNEKYMLAGFAEADITPEIGMEQPGGYGKSYHKSFHDPCKVRVSVFDDGKNTTAVVGVDLIMVPRSLVLKVRRQVENRCGIPADAILIAASHSHSSGPVGVQPGEYDHGDELVRSLAYEHSITTDLKYIAHVEKSLVEAICKAYDTRRESSVGVGKGIEDKVAFNRRFKMKNGWCYTHPGQGNPDIVEPAGPTDPEVGVVGVWDKDGKCTGCIVNFACHATTNPGGISANWIYYMEQTIRGAMGPECIVVFVPGANGDVTQVNNLNPYKNPAGEDWTRFVGAQVGAEAVKVLLNMPRGIMTPISVKNKILVLDRRIPDPERVKKCYEIVKKTPEEAGHTEWAFAKEIVLLDASIKKEPKEEVEIQAVQLGPVVFVTNPTEFFCQLGLDIKKGSHFKYTFPVELANGCCGYVPTAEALGPGGGGYETRLTKYSNLEVQAGNKMVDAGVELANQMTPGAEPEFPKAPPFSGQPWSYGNVKPELK
jgi:hypothetical protein